MPSPASLLGLAAVVSVFGTCCAQSVYVVDGLNRPGTNFLDLPAAVAAAQHGDTIRLRSDGGIYTAVTTSKGLTIVGEPVGPAIFSPAGPGFLITGLPAGRDFVLRNIGLFGGSTGGALSTPRLRVEACLGRVHLQQLEITDLVGNPAVDVFACQAVTVRDCDLVGFPGLIARNTTIAVSATRMNGQPASALRPSFPGARLQDATAFFANVQFQGGNAYGTQAPSPGLLLIGASASLTGSSNASRCNAGFLGNQAAPGFTAAVPAIDGQNSLLRFDPDVTLAPTGGAVAITGVSSTTAQIPAFAIEGNAALGVSFDGGLASAQVTLLGFPADPLSIPGVEGRVWVDDNGLWVLPGVLDGYGGFFETMIPTGITIALQVVNLQGGLVELTTPAMVTSRR